MQIGRRDLAVAGALVLAGFFLLRPGYVVPDSLATWSWLRSLWFDGDLLFFNEWAAFGRIRDGVPEFKEVTHLGTLANHWWIGSSVVALVPYAIAHVCALIAPALGTGGLGGVYGWSLAWLSVGSLWLVWLVVANVTTQRERGELLCFAMLIVGTPVFWYAFRFPTMSHLPGAAAVAILVWTIHKLELDPHQRYEYGMGLALGAASAIRLQHALMLPAVIVALLLLRRPPGSWLRVAAGVTPFALLQGAAWHAVYGTPLGPLVSGVDPAGGTWAAFRSPAMLEALFSPWNGLFVWSPIVLLAVAGWVAEARAGRWRVLALVCMVMFLGQWVANGAMDRWWWGGLSFGPRRWVDLAAVVLLGLVWTWRRWRISFPVMALCAAWSACLIAAAASGSLELSGPTGWPELGRGVVNIDWSAALTALLKPALPGALAVAASVTGLIAVMIYATVLTVLAHRRWLEIAGAGVAVLMLGWVSLAIIPTRERAAFFLRAFGIDAATSQLGALIDRRDLMSRELQWLEQTGGAREEAVRRELDALDQQIRTPLSSVTAPRDELPRSSPP